MLTPNQQRFVERYLVHLNASRAARESGSAPGTAAAAGSRLKRVPAVKAAIKEAIDARTERLRVNADKVVRELARVAFADLSNLAEWNGDHLALRPNDGVDIDDRVAIAELAFVKGASGGSAVRIKLHDKLRALDMLARHLGLFSKGPIAMTGEEIVAAQERLRAMIRERLAHLAIPEEEEDDSSQSSVISSQSGETEN